MAIVVLDYNRKLAIQSSGFVKDNPLKEQLKLR